VDQGGPQWSRAVQGELEGKTNFLTFLLMSDISSIQIGARTKLLFADAVEAELRETMVCTWLQLIF
jgi:hypothetical protein